MFTLHCNSNMHFHSQRLNNRCTLKKCIFDVPSNLKRAYIYFAVMYFHVVERISGLVSNVHLLQLIVTLDKLICVHQCMYMSRLKFI